jgi:hypothetical protein
MVVIEGVIAESTEAQISTTIRDIILETLSLGGSTYFAMAPADPRMMGRIDNAVHEVLPTTIKLKRTVTMPICERIDGQSS